MGERNMSEKTQRAKSTTESNSKSSSKSSKKKLGQKLARKKFRPDMLVDIYLLLKRECSILILSETLGVTPATFNTWKKKYPSIRRTIKRAKQELKSTFSFRDYVYKKLPPSLKELWNEINEYDKSNLTRAQLEACFTRHGGKRAKQHLFIYALVKYHFNSSRACSAVGITKFELDRWMDEEGFKRLVQEMHWHKQNLYEEGLMKLVKEGDAAAVIFANKTINRARGYAERKEMEVTVTGQIQHNHVSFAQLDLPLEIKKIVYDAIKAKKLEERQKDIDFHATGGMGPGHRLLPYEGNKKFPPKKDEIIDVPFEATDDQEESEEDE